MNNDRTYLNEDNVSKQYLKHAEIELEHLSGLVSGAERERMENAIIDVFKVICDADLEGFNFEFLRYELMRLLNAKPVCSVFGTCEEWELLSEYDDCKQFYNKRCPSVRKYVNGDKITYADIEALVVSHDGGRTYSYDALNRVKIESFPYYPKIFPDSICKPKEDLEREPYPYRFGKDLYTSIDLQFAIEHNGKKDCKKTEKG